jgi:hypothetical protein
MVVLVVTSIGFGKDESYERSTIPSMPLLQGSTAGIRTSARPYRGDKWRMASAFW